MKNALVGLLVMAALIGRTSSISAAEVRDERLLAQGTGQAMDAVRDFKDKRALDPQEALRLFADAAEIEALITTKRNQGFVPLGPAQAALLYASLGDEGFFRVYLVTQPMLKGQGPFLTSASVSAVVSIDAFGRSVKSIDSGRLWDAVRSLTP